jgi:hypothetical protein
LYASYLYQEVFTSMSDLPLVFPSNISCFSGGSFAEELTRWRDLPVPPLPRRSGALAKSEDNLTGKERHTKIISHPDKTLLIHLATPGVGGGGGQGKEDRASATWLGRKKSNKHRSHEEMPVVPSAYNEIDEEIRHVACEHVQSVQCSNDEQTEHMPS